ncbi:hypothetical protein BKA82DRAFT_4061984 [Pisolithus tinctorius]|nr:hypothetical protein BKA82DRAFT_4061984 [Pisolithus tinctorius]
MFRVVPRWARPNGHAVFCERKLSRKLHNGRTLVEELTCRGFIANVTRPHELNNHLGKCSRMVYAGIDPTAESLHAGHLIPLLCLLHFQLRGNNIITLIGGATGLVGDPSGRSTERELSDAAQVELNASKLTYAISRFFSRASVYAASRGFTQQSVIPEVQVLNNINWLKDLNLLDFLRSTGPHFRINQMIARDSVRTRMNAQQGINFTEFTYQLLQAYDFYELYRTKGCTVQIGGSDQWGNILSGLELINKAQFSRATVAEQSSEKGFALTTPLLTTSSGEKFGKSAGNAIWLDESLSSHLDFYQFFLRTADADVVKYLKMFTLLPVEEIESIAKNHESHPEHRIAQRILAEEVMLLVHGEDGLSAAKVATKVLFGTDYSSLRADQIIRSLRNDPRLVFCSQDEMFAELLPNLTAIHGLLPSKSAARQLVLAGGLYVNNVPVRDPRLRLTREGLLDGRVAVVRAGKDKHLVLVLK